MRVRVVDLFAAFALLLIGPTPSAATAAPLALPSLCEPITFEADSFIACTVDPEHYDIRLFLREPDGQPYGSLENFAANGPAVVFAMNAGMYLPDRTPQGLYVEAGNTIMPLVTADGEGNFYLKPNGVFLVTIDQRADNGDSRFVRNGVGVRPDGKVVFAISQQVVSFGRFARLFRDALACPDALYLDGFVSALADDNGVLVGGGHAAGPIVAVLAR